MYISVIQNRTMNSKGENYAMFFTLEFCVCKIEYVLYYLCNFKGLFIVIIYKVYWDVNVREKNTERGGKQLKYSYKNLTEALLRIGR
jgi:hypothetical protein